MPTCIIRILQEIGQRLPATSFNVKKAVRASQLVLGPFSVLVDLGIVASIANVDYHLASTSATGRLTMVAGTTQKIAT